jgi:hypothetical protein
MMKSYKEIKRGSSESTFFNSYSSSNLMTSGSKRRFICNEKRCYGKTLWLRYLKKEKITSETEKGEEKNETVLKSKSSK